MFWGARPGRLALHLAVASLAAGLLGVGGAAVAAPQDSATPAPAAAALDALDVLVLGDSYSAGNGATDDQGAEQTYGPDGCRRSQVNWGEKYAAALRQSGYQVRLTNHACSGGKAVDLASPRRMDTASKAIATPAGVTTPGEADTYLATADPCNTHRFPDEEFWTYHATAVTAVVISYDCTRNLRPQADFVTPDVDLVLYTMGGNDAGFSAIVQSCFVFGLRTAAGCKTKVDAARAELPLIGPRLQAGVAAIRAHGLRTDARLVQLGYPYLQVDNGFTLTDGTGTYDAGAQVRALGAEGNAAFAALAPVANAAHPGQASFLTGVPEKFAGHEPDAQFNNPARWINQVGDGSSVDVWYHPNRLGHTAYAELLAAQGTFGLPVDRSAVTAALKVRAVHLPATSGQRVRLRIKVTLSDGSRPRGTLVVRGLPGHRRLATTKLRTKDHGSLRLTLRLGDRRVNRLRIVYRDRVAPVVKVTRRVHQRR